MTSGKRARAALRFVTPAVVLANALLVVTGVFDIGRAVLVALGMEVLLAVVTVVLLVAAGTTYRRRRELGDGRGQALAAAAQEILPPPLWSLARHELAILNALLLVLRRRIDAPDGAATFGYGKSQAPLFYGLAGISLLEIVLFEWLIPWPWLKLTIAVLSVYGAVWVFAFYQLMRRKPHYLTDRMLAVRCGAIVRLDVPLDAIDSVRSQMENWGNRFYEATDDQVIAIKPAGYTNVRLRLNRTVEAGTGRGPLSGTCVCLAADDPDLLVSTLRKQLVDQTAG
uniref:Uncharacterized protein n=1 Tax=Streptomyces olivoviridis TaxID=67338 RepID=T2HUX2_9ACTN|nr:hypothetical protein [Streptomyces olivoviridis]BBI93412.1 hypothetical protein [Streptomyces olivoviridis]